MQADIDAWLPADSANARARDDMLDAARASGLRSDAYRAARQRLIALM